MDACPDWTVGIAEEIRVSLTVGLTVTVDQPPLAVGVRFPLCPPIFFNDDGPIGPVALFLRRDEKSADPRGGQLTHRRISARQRDWAADSGLDLVSQKCLHRCDGQLT